LRPFTSTYWPVPLASVVHWVALTVLLLAFSMI
jgi:hypothetical protein